MENGKQEQYSAEAASLTALDTDAIIYRMNVFLGISASGGTGIGTAFVLPDPQKRIIRQTHIAETETKKEWDRFEKAVQVVLLQIESELKQISTAPGADTPQKEILETYILMLQDTVFLSELKKTFETELFNMEYILDKKTSDYSNQLRNSGNEYLSERAQDITDVFGRVLDELLDIHPFNINFVPDGSVIVAQTLNPSDTIILSNRKIAGLALTEGGISSHVAIIARNYGIPAVFALNKISSNVTTGEQIIVDGTTGEVIAGPDAKTLAEYNEKIKKEIKHQEVLKLFRKKPGQTKDGTPFQILANIGTPEEAKQALEEGADGIGLFRTEFLFMSESQRQQGATSLSFSEDDQFSAYKEVLQIMKGKPVTIRTLDAGGDKLINSVDIPMIEEKNPLLGLRAIRLSLKHRQLLKTQLRALYRASIYGDLKIMLPLITSVDQVVEVRKMAKEVQDELEFSNIPFDHEIPIGIMVETAAAAVTADCLTQVSDFFSIGTNDLTQYTIGVDRENPAVAPLYNEFHLAVLRLIQQTLTAGQEAGIPVSVCGEMASKADSVMVLAGMGIRSLSMSPKHISMVKEELSKITIKELQAISSKSLNSL